MPPDTVATKKPNPATPVLASWEQEAREYLTSKGWKEVLRDVRGNLVWSNAVQGKEEKRVVGQLKSATTGKMENIEQLIVPALAWQFSTEEALSIQRGRDDDATKAAEAFRKAS